MIKDVNIAVMPLAGYGTRFLPASKSVPKEMFPILDRPCLQWVVEELVLSGISKVIFVTSLTKVAIENYFDHDRNLTAFLKEKGKTIELTRVREVEKMIDFVITRQREPKGLGDAIYQAKRCTGDDPFLVLLGDDIILGDPPCSRQLMDIYYETGKNVVALIEVTPEETDNYGIVTGEMIENRVFRIDSAWEKPGWKDRDSYLGIVGRYLFTPDIYRSLEGVDRGTGGEIQVTDAIHRLAEKGEVLGCLFEGERFDAGTPDGYLRTVIAIAMKDERWRGIVLNELRKYQGIT